jgi:hypothetical protein
MRWKRHVQASSRKVLAQLTVTTVVNLSPRRGVSLFQAFVGVSHVNQRVNRSIVVRMRRSGELQQQQQQQQPQQQIQPDEETERPGEPTEPQG